MSRKLTFKRSSTFFSAEAVWLTSVAKDTNETRVLWRSGGLKRVERQAERRARRPANTKSRDDVGAV